MGRTHRSSSFLVFAVSGGLIVACGARGPLDDDGPLDAGAPDVIDTVDAAEAAPPPMTDATAPIVDAAPEGGSIVNCATCLFSQCSQGIVQCLQDAACRTTFQCVVTKCVAGGGTPSPACLFNCASGDVKGALKIFNIFTCVTGKCGSDCNSLLSGLVGGLGGGGGGGGGTMDAGRGGGMGGGGMGGGMRSGAAGRQPEGHPDMMMTPFAQAISSQWPSLCEAPPPKN